MYSILNLVVGRTFFFAYYERLTGTLVGFEKVGKWRVPFALQCKYTEYTIQPCLKCYLLVVD
jgi:hypothetical protein